MIIWIYKISLKKIQWELWITMEFQVPMVMEDLKYIEMVGELFVLNMIILPPILLVWWWVMNKVVLSLLKILKYAPITMDSIIVVRKCSPYHLPIWFVKVMNPRLRTVIMKSALNIVLMKKIWWSVVREMEIPQAKVKNR